jgi:hypothetical protein
VIELHLSPHPCASSLWPPLSPSPSPSSPPFQPFTSTPPPVPEPVLPAPEIAMPLQPAMPPLPATPLGPTGDHPQTLTYLAQPLEPTAATLATTTKNRFPAGLGSVPTLQKTLSRKAILHTTAGSAISNKQCMFYVCKHEKDNKHVKDKKHAQQGGIARARILIHFGLAAGLKV